MSIIRVEKTKDYTIMSNHHLKEKQMSLKAKGLLSLMLSLPDNWDYTIAGLVAICKENETAIKSTLDELKEFHYLEIIKNMPNEENGGRINYEYIVYEKPIQGDKKQGVENLGVEIQGVENPAQLNTNILNTNILNTKKENIMLKENAKCIIQYLNESIGTKYKVNSKETLKLIGARFKDGYVLDDFYDVIDKKVKEWANTDMQKYLRPSTLFGNKFENYVNQKNYFNGSPKTTYGSKPTFDNTANNLAAFTKISDNDFYKLTRYEKIEYLSKVSIADMTEVQKKFFNENCLAKDENGNILEF